MEPKLAELNILINRLLSLTEDPEPGCYTWVEALNKQLKLIENWRYETFTHGVDYV